MIFDSSLVIHAGKLVPINVARAQMMVEFPPRGYSVETIETFLQRAHRATQTFLSQLADLTPEKRQLPLQNALREDAARAEQWREYWRAHPDRDWGKYQADKLEVEARFQRQLEEQRKREAETRKRWLEEEGQRQREREKAEAERRERYKQEQEKAAEARRKAEWVQQCKRWEALNERGGWKAGAAERARERKAKDHDMWLAILRRIHGGDGGGRQSYWVPELLRGGTRESMLNLLNDHEYVEWMFDCYSQRLTTGPGKSML